MPARPVTQMAATTWRGAYRPDCGTGESHRCFPTNPREPSCRPLVGRTAHAVLDSRAGPGNLFEPDAAEVEGPGQVIPGHVPQDPANGPGVEPAGLRPCRDVLQAHLYPVAASVDRSDAIEAGLVARAISVVVDAKPEGEGAPGLNRSRLS